MSREKQQWPSGSGRSPVKSYLSRILLGSAMMPAAVGASPPIQAQADLKVAVVDLDMVIEGTPAGKRLQQKLRDFESEARTELQAKEEQLREIRRQGTEGAGVLSQEELARLQREFERLQGELARLQQDKQREGERLQQEGFKEIQDLLEPVLQEVRAEGNYDLILNRTPGIVLYTSERIDITKRVGELLKGSGNAGKDGN